MVLKEHDGCILGGVGLPFYPGPRGEERHLPRLGFLLQALWC